MRVNTKKRMVQCVNAETCPHDCIHGAKLPHKESPMCTHFKCTATGLYPGHDVYCVPVKGGTCPASSVDEYLKRLGQD